MTPTKIIAAICSFFVLLIVLVLGFGSWGTIDAGNVGVVLRMGAVTGEIKPAGMYTKTPWMETVEPVNVQVQKVEVSGDAASRDLQTVTTHLALNVHIDPSKAAYILQTYGANAIGTFVDPALNESMKAAIARYTAEELVTKRETVRDGIAALVREKLQPQGFITDAVNIVNMDFSKSFNDAIELKVTAEQSALAAQNKLSQVKFEADQAAALAKGKAEAMTIESNALRSNPQILQLRALEKWNGVLPQVVGSGGIPFINLSTSGVAATP